MVKLLIELFQQYGLGALQLGIIVWFCWIFMTNHWKHFTKKIDDMHRDVKGNRRAIDRLRDRVSRLEGKVDK